MADEMRIQVMNGGPYVVSGGVPLKEIAPVQTLNKENVDWHVLREIDEFPRPLRPLPLRPLQRQALLRRLHASEPWPEAETADRRPMTDRANRIEGAAGVMLDDESVCIGAGFCGTRTTNAWDLIGEEGDEAASASRPWSGAAPPAASPSSPPAPRRPSSPPSTPRSRSCRWPALGAWRRPRRERRRHPLGGAEPPHALPLWRLQQQALLRRRPQRPALRRALAGGVHLAQRMHGVEHRACRSVEPLVGCPQLAAKGLRQRQVVAVVDGSLAKFARQFKRPGVQVRRRVEIKV